MRKIASIACCLLTLPAIAFASTRPNVLLIAIDDLRPELGCYGAEHVKSPHIDALSQSGLIFDRAYCQQAVCNPSRTSLMTGLRPDTIGVTGNHSHFRDNRPHVVTLPELFKNHGYHAQCIGKLYHGVFPDGASKTKWDTMGDPQSWSVPATRFGPRYYYTEDGIRQAKQAFLASYRPRDPAPDDWTKKLVFGPMTEAPDVPDNTLYDGKVTDAAEAALAQLKGTDTPFLLAVGFIKPHTPFVAPKKYYDLYNESEIALAENPEFPTNAPRMAGHGSNELRRYTDQPNRGPFTPENQRRLRHGYFACISFIDAQVGRVLAALDRHGLSENTIVVLYGDHGWHLGEHGLWGKTTNFELDTRVPLIVRAPGGQLRPGRTPALVEFVDLYPTLADLAGLPLPVDLDGVSFVPLLKSPDRPWKTAAFSQYPRGKAMGYSMRTDDWRYTEWIHRDTQEVVARELYDHQHGRPETANVAASPERSSLVGQLSAQLAGGSGWKSVKNELPTAQPPATSTVYEKGDGAGSRHGYRIPAVTLTEEGTVLAFCERRIGLNDHAQNDIVLRRSEDGGATWGELHVIADEGGDSLNDPIVVPLRSGRILLRYKRYPQGVHSRNSAHTVIAEPGYGGPNNTRVYLTHSDDDGRTWSTPREVTKQMRRREAINVGSPGVGLQLERGPHEGRILFPNYEVYNLGNGKRKSANSVSYSDDNGETWTLTDTIAEGDLPGFGNEAQLVELSDGGILMSSRSHDGGGYRKLATSSDGGASWSAHRFATELRTPACMSSIIRYAWPTAKQSGLLLHSLPHTKRSRSNGTIFYSRDEGKSWTAGPVIQPNGFAYSSLIKLPNGDVGCLYETGGYRKIVFQRISIQDILEARPAPTKIACIGDSITYGAGIRDRDRQSYPARLQQLLGDKYLVRNFGKSGADVLAINNGPYAKTPQHRDALAFRPDIVVCNLGINDITLLEKNKRAFVSDYTDLLKQYAQGSSQPSIYLWTDLAPVMPSQPNYDRYLKLRSDYRALLDEIAQQMGAKGIDMFKPLAEHPEWFPDALHPNAAGAAVIAQTVADAVAPDEPRFKFVADSTPRGRTTTGDASFENARPGGLSELTTPHGVWTAEQGHAEIDAAHARTGRRCLHILGGRNRQIEFEANKEAEGAGLLSFWAERWTRRPPFRFRIEQRMGNKWVEIYNGDKQIAVGGFKTRVSVALKQGESPRLRFTSTSPNRSGLLIDDVEFAKPTPMAIGAVVVEQPVLPALVGTEASAISRLRIDVAGNTGDAPVVTSVSVSTAGSTDSSDIKRVGLFYTADQELVAARGNPNTLAGATPFGRTTAHRANLQFRGKQQLQPGANYFWVAYQLSKDADIDHRVHAIATELKLANGKVLAVKDATGGRGQRLGRAVRKQGDDGVHTYRIPGLATTNHGTLIGVYDIRRRGGGDLPGDIDVGMSRSTDGGQTWEPMEVIMDMGNDPAWRYDGIGDPTVMVDRKTNTVWVAATWSHGNRSWFGSGPGVKPAETGQFMLVRSDDDGRTWSKPINITQQVKKPEWCFLLQGPGKGFTMLDGTLVLPAQYQDTPENRRLPRSTFIYSRDHGDTWQIATGAFDDTTESQVVELQPGELMINCRYNREPRRVVMTTTDMGKSWQTHPTSRKALIEPGACMASLINVDNELRKKVGGWLLFSNPNSLRGRRRMTIKASNDAGLTWPEARQVLLDEAPSAGYSCMSMIDENTVGILYEGSQAHMTFQRVPLVELTASPDSPKR